MKILLLRVLHGVFVAYFAACLGYVYYAALTGTFNVLLLLALVSLAGEGFIVYVLNHGDCPLIHIQRKIGDDKPFFELFFPPHVAARAMPVFAILAWTGLAVLIIRFVTDSI